jgi:hypothetical protein
LAKVTTTWEPDCMMTEVTESSGAPGLEWQVLSGTKVTAQVPPT